MGRDEFDLIAVGRAIIANWNWVRLVREGRMRDLAPSDEHTLAQSTAFDDVEYGEAVVRWGLRDIPGLCITPV